MKVLGVDGGLHTGCAIYDTSKTLVDNAIGYREQSWQFIGDRWDGEWRQARLVVDLVLDHDVKVLCVEDFILLKFGGMQRSGLSSPRVIAMVDAVMKMEYGDLYSDDVGILREGGVYRFSRQASVAKTTYNNARLQKLGIWKGISAHERDAWRHVLTFCKGHGYLKK